MDSIKNGGAILVYVNRNPKYPDRYDFSANTGRKRTERRTIAASKLEKNFCEAINRSGDLGLDVIIAENKEGKLYAAEILEPPKPAPQA